MLVIRSTPDTCLDRVVCRAEDGAESVAEDEFWNTNVTGESERDLPVDPLSVGHTQYTRHQFQEDVKKYDTLYSPYISRV